MLRAKPVALIISYHTRGFVEVEKNGCPIGQPLYTKYVMRGSSQVTTPIIPPTSISFILQAQPMTQGLDSIIDPQVRLHHQPSF